MKLTLLRHGETDGSRRDLYYGAADIPALPESLAALHENAAAYPRAARYYTSGLLRTEQTLEAIYGPVAHQQLPGLREMNFGDFEMKSYQELKDTAAYQAWITDVEHNVCPNGESAPRCWSGTGPPWLRCWRRGRTPCAWSTAASRRG